MSRKQFLCLQVVGLCFLVFSVVYLLNPATGPYDFRTGTYRPEWTPSLVIGGIAGVIGGVVGGRLVKRMGRMEGAGH